MKISKVYFSILLLMALAIPLSAFSEHRSSREISCEQKCTKVGIDCESSCTLKYEQCMKPSSGKNPGQCISESEACTVLCIKEEGTCNDKCIGS